VFEMTDHPDSKAIQQIIDDSLQEIVDMIKERIPDQEPE